MQHGPSTQFQFTDILSVLGRLTKNLQNSFADAALFWYGLRIQTKDVTHRFLIMSNRIRQCPLF